MKLDFISRMKAEDVFQTPKKKLNHQEGKNFLQGRITKGSYLFEIGSESKKERFVKYQYSGKVVEEGNKIRFDGEIKKTQAAKIGDRISSAIFAVLLATFTGVLGFILTGQMIYAVLFAAIFALVGMLINLGTDKKELKGSVDFFKQYMKKVFRAEFAVLAEKGSSKKSQK